MDPNPIYVYCTAPITIHVHIYPAILAPDVPPAAPEPPAAPPAPEPPAAPPPPEPPAPVAADLVSALSSSALPTTSALPTSAHPPRLPVCPDCGLPVSKSGLRCRKCSHRARKSSLAAASKSSMSPDTAPLGSSILAGTPNLSRARAHMAAPDRSDSAYDDLDISELHGERIG